MQVFTSETLEAQLDGQTITVHKLGEGDYAEATEIFNGSDGYCAVMFAEDAPVYKAEFCWSPGNCEGRSPGELVGFLRAFGPDVVVHHETSSKQKVAFDKDVLLTIKTTCKDGVCYQQVDESPLPVVDPYQVPTEDP